MIEGDEKTYLQQTKEWFEKAFPQIFNEDCWKDFPFSNLLNLNDRNEFVAPVMKLLYDQNISSDFSKNMLQGGILYDSLVTPIENTVYKPTGQLAEQFSTNYKGTVNEKLLRQINSCYKQWCDQPVRKWHSPYLSIVQSSGYGKSRACKEIATAENEWYTVFICCRNRKWYGYPPTTKEAVQFFDTLLTISSTEAEGRITRWIKWLKFFRLAFRYVFLHYDMEMAAIVSKFIETQFVELIDESKLEERFTAKKEEDERATFWSLCFDDTNQTHISQIFNFVNNTSTESERQIPTLFDRKKFLLVVDEARFLCVNKFLDSDRTLFRTFRTAISTFETGLFVVVVDTQSHIANFAPSRHLDPSLRLEEGDTETNTKDLFHPFTAVTTTDVLCTNVNFNDPKHRFTLGRPLWKTTYDQCRSVNRLIDFALKKLFGGKDVLTDKATENLQNEGGRIACIAVLTGFNTSPISTVANELVASHMATCLAIDSKRDSLLITYPVEPVLTEAAKGYVIAMWKQSMIKEVFQPLLNCFRIGAIDRGQNGELVAKLLLLFGHFKISRRGQITASCTGVLNAVFGAAIENANAYILPHDTFSFNCFSELFVNVEYWTGSNAQTELELFFNRGTAIQLPKGHIGADLLLPIRRSHHTKNGNVEYLYKYLLLQIKNRKDNITASKVKVIRNKLKKTFPMESSWAMCNIGFAIIMNVGQIKENTGWDGEYFVVNGLGPTSYGGVLKDDLMLADTLRKMLREPSIDDWIVERGEEYSKKEQKDDFYVMTPISLRPSIEANVPSERRPNKKRKK